MISASTVWLNAKGAISGVIGNTVGVSLSFVFSFHEAWRAAFTTASSYDLEVYDSIAGVMTAAIGLEQAMGPIWLILLERLLGLQGILIALSVLKLGLSVV